MSTLDLYGPGAAALFHQRPTWSTPEARMKVIAAASKPGATIVWDFDGVIADTEPVQRQSFIDLLAEYGFEPDVDFWWDMMGHTEPDIWLKLIQLGATVPSIPGAIAARALRYQGLALSLLKPSWLFLDLLNVDTIHLVNSNGKFENNVALLSHWGLLDRVAIEDRIGQTKEEAVRSLAANGPVVNVEDSPRYAAIARDAGCFVVGVRHGLSRGPIVADVIVSI